MDAMVAALDARVAIRNQFQPKLARLDDVDVRRGATIVTSHFEGADLAALGAALRGPVDIVAFTSRRGVEAALAAAPERVRALPCYALGADRDDARSGKERNIARLEREFSQKRTLPTDFAPPTR